MPDRPRPPTWAEDWIILPFLEFGDRMFALIAAILLILVALGVTADAVDLFVLGLAFWALHFAVGTSLTPWRK